MKGASTVCALLLVLVSSFCLEVGGAASAAGQDPCTSHSLIVGMPERSMEADLLPFDKPICDKSLASDAAWYRVLHEEDGERTGEDMPTWPPGINHCGTVYPIWINGSLPHTIGEVVERTACSDGGSSKASSQDRCFEQRSVKIKHCDGYNVYWLPRVTSCPHAYCFGEVPCPPGWTSPTGFEPLCKVSNFIEMPVVSWTIGRNSDASLEFLCSLPSRPLERDLLVNVTWSLDYISEKGAAVSTSLLGFGGARADELPAILPEGALPSDFRYNAQIACNILPWTMDGRVGNSKSSKPFFAGIEVSPRKINLFEGEKQTIELTATVPIMCRRSNVSEADSNGCTLALAAQVSPSCSRFVNGPPANNLLIEGLACGSSFHGLMTRDAINSSFVTHVNVVATVDGKFGWSQETVSKTVKLTTVSFPSVAKTWHGLELPEIEVKILDRDRIAPPAMCYSNDDPHMQTFDKRPYEMHQQGAFVLYRNRLFEVEVQSFYQMCSPNSRVTCNCAVAVRSGLAVFVLDACYKVHTTTRSTGQFFRVGTVGCIDRGMTVSHSGNTYEVKLPTGAVVRIAYNQHGPYSVNIVPGSHFDKHSTEGLCGVYSGSLADDFRLSNGSTLVDYSPDFAKSWRVPASESLFAKLHTFGDSIEKKLQQPRTLPPEAVAQQYCNCDASRQLQSGTRGSSFQVDCLRTPAIAEKSCPTNAEAITCFLKDTAKRGDLLFELFEYFDDNSNGENQVHDWRNGWTEQRATSHCRDYLLSNSALKSCFTVPSVNIEKAIKQCVLDIKLIGSTEYQFVALELIIAECKAEAERNVTMWEPSSINGTLELPKWLVHGLCQENCSNNGICDSGVCKCRQPYYGIDCSADERTPPTLEESVGRCDENTSSTSCINGVRVYGRGFSTRMTGLVCLFEANQMAKSANSIMVTETTKGTLESMGELMCSLPPAVKAAIDERRLPQWYNISVSNDGKTFSNRLPILIFDSSCHTCNYATGSCRQQVNVCIIYNVCYKSGYPHPDRSGRQCQPATNASDWTTPEGLLTPQVTQLPRVTWQLVEDTQQPTSGVKELAFECSLNHPHEQLLAFDVTWIFETTNGRATSRNIISTIRNVSQSQFPLLLRQSQCGRDFKFGVKIACEMLPYYITSKLKGKAVISQPFFAGIEASPTQVVLLEGGVQVLQLRATVPILCHPNTSASDCKVAVVASVYPSCQPQKMAGIAENNVLLDGPDCGVIINGWLNDNSFNGNLTSSVKLIATVDGKFGWSHDEVVKQIKLQTMASSAVSTAWHSLDLPDVQVKIIDRDRSLPSGMCYSNDDPHMQTFDRRPYEMHQQGSFILYQNDLFDTEVQSFYQRCSTNSLVTCNCAVAVRSGVDVFILDACDKIRLLTKARGRFYRAGIIGCAGRGMAVRSYGNTYEISLPTGAVVRILFNAATGPYSVTVVPGSWLDMNSTGGLCGLFSGKQVDDFRFRNGTTLSDYIPDFANDWRVPVQESLFVTLAAYGGDLEGHYKETSNDTMTRRYCNCDSSNHLKSSSFLSGFTKLTCAQTDGVAGRSCPTINSTSASCNLRGNAKTGDLLFESFDYIYDSGIKDSEVPVWKNGWSEQKATAHCRDYLLTNGAVKSCMTSASVNAGRAIDQCVLDIKLMGSTEYSHVALQQVLSECKAEAERNVSSWNPDRGNSTSGLPDWLLDSLCPANCTGRGTCKSGLCECSKYYYGADCSSDERIPPVLHESIGLCDEGSNTTSCRGRVPVYGSGFSTLRTSVTCKFEIIDALGAPWFELTSASVEGIGQALCNIPKSLAVAIKEKRLPQHFNVSVSNDGNLFSNKVFLLIYDSNCHICRDAAGSCISKPDVCIIEGICYASNSQHPTKAGLVCEPQASTTNWTIPQESRLPTVSRIPVVEWRLVGGGSTPRELWFVCSHSHHQEPLLAFDVTWRTETFGRVPALRGSTLLLRNVSQDSFPLLLHPREFGADFKFGVKVFCEIVPYYRTSKLKGSALTSLALIAGVQVTPTAITLTEGETASVTLTPTIPITCASASTCALRVLVAVSSEGSPSSATKNNLCNSDAAAASVLVSNTDCGVTVSGIGSDLNSTWSPRESSLVISSRVDGRLGLSDRETRVIRLQTAVAGHANSAWEGVQLPDVHVTILDGDRKVSQGQCFSNDDPYMRTFDLRTYHMHHQGPFVLYKHRIYPVEVQAFYQACPLRPGATCNCGVAVRSGDDVFLYDHCTKIRKASGQKGRFFRAGIVSCGAANMRVVSSATSYEIITSTLTRVIISYNQGGPYSINIVSSLLDFNATDGLCGQFNGIATDDFRHPNGRVSANYDDQFAFGWRLPFEESIFAQLPAFGGSSSNSTNSSQAPAEDKLTQCACEGDVFNYTVSSVVCKKTAIAKKECLMNSASSTGIVPRYCIRQNGSSNDMFFEDYDYEYDGSSKPKPIPGWSNGWSEQSARAHCTNYIRDSLAGSGCLSLSVVRIDIGIEQCIEGIKLAGSTAFDFTALEQVRRDCISAIERNTSWVNGTTAAQEANLCPNNCSGNGRCIKGLCVCNKHYVESDCSLDQRIPPTLEASEQPCDLGRSPCTRLRLSGSGVSSQASNLTCRLEVAPVGDTPSAIPVAISTKAWFISYGELSCEAPENIRNLTAPLIFNVSASNDGIHFGNSVRAVIYDGTCHTCNVSTMSCSIKVNKCFIAGVCYAAGSASSDNGSLICRPDTRQNNWTYNITTASPATEPAGSTSPSVPTQQPSTCGACQVSGTQYFPRPRSDCRLFSAYNNASYVRIVCPPRTRFSVGSCRCAAEEQADCLC